MTRKAITTSHAAVSCEVCGRTLLRGEQAEPFIAGGTRRLVCNLCTARAANEGWIREGLEDTLSTHRHGRERRGSLLRRLRDRAARPDLQPLDGDLRPIEEAAEPAPEPAPPEPAPQPVRKPAPQPAREEPAWEPPREQRRVHAIPTHADLKRSRAVELFNASRHRRTVAGVARSLGDPLVAVRPSATEGSIVSIVVGWELSWYRYEVDLADEEAGVRLVAQGAELTELEPEDQAPNAVADERGTLALAD
jgi:hypothetical protein